MKKTSLSYSYSLELTGFYIENEFSFVLHATECRFLCLEVDLNIKAILQLSSI